MANVKSAKAKGRRLQNYVRDILRSTFPQLEKDDIKSQTMGMCGEDIVLSPLAKETIPYSFECKNKERISVWADLAQAESNCEDRAPVLIIKRNRSKVYAVIELDEFINLIRNTYGNKTDNG